MLAVAVDRLQTSGSPEIDSKSGPSCRNGNRITPCFRPKLAGISQKQHSPSEPGDEQNPPVPLTPPPSPPSASPPRVYEVCPLPLIAQSRVLGRVSGALFSFQLPMLNHGTVDGHTGDLSSVQSKQKNRTTPGLPRPANYHCLLISSIGELGARLSTCHVPTTGLVPRTVTSSDTNHRRTYGAVASED